MRIEKTEKVILTTEEISLLRNARDLITDIYNDSIEEGYLAMTATIMDNLDALLEECEEDI